MEDVSTVMPIAPSTGSIVSEDQAAALAAKGGKAIGKGIGKLVGSKKVGKGIGKVLGAMGGVGAKVGGGMAGRALRGFLGFEAGGKIRRVPVRAFATGGVIVAVPHSKPRGRPKKAPASAPKKRGRPKGSKNKK